MSPIALSTPDENSSLTASTSLVARGDQAADRRAVEEAQAQLLHEREDVLAQVRHRQGAGELHAVHLGKHEDLRDRDDPRQHRPIAHQKRRLLGPGMRHRLAHDLRSQEDSAPPAQTAPASTTRTWRRCGRMNGHSRRKQLKVVALFQRLFLVEGAELLLGLAGLVLGRALSCLGSLRTSGTGKLRGLATGRSLSAELFELAGDFLLFGEASVDAAPGEELLMGPLLDDAAAIEDHDMLTARCRSDPVGDKDHRAALAPDARCCPGLRPRSWHLLPTADRRAPTAVAATEAPGPAPPAASARRTAARRARRRWCPSARVDLRSRSAPGPRGRRRGSAASRPASPAHPGQSRCCGPPWWKTKMHPAAHSRSRCAPYAAAGHRRRDHR